MNIWLVSIFEQTPVDENASTRFNNIARAALNRGHRVTYFASTFKHNTKVQRFKESTHIQQEENYDLVFLKSRSYQKNISPKRMRAHSRYAKDLIKAFDQYNEKPDIVLAALPPISNAYEISKWSQLQNVPFVVDIIDPWPDLFRRPLAKFPKLIQDVLLKPLEKQVEKAFGQASAVTAISQQYLQWASQYADLNKTGCFYPAVPFADNQAYLEQFNQEINHIDGFQVIYAGSLASSYDIPTMLKAAEQLEAKYGDDIQFVIAGAGPQEGIINDYTERHANLTYKGRLGKEELMRQYGKSDLGLTQHVKGATQSVTYKLFDLLSCGIPILNSLESEMKDLILNHEVGLFNKPGDADQLAENIAYYYENPEALKAAQSNALQMTKELGDAEKVFDEYVQFLENCSAE